MSDEPDRISRLKARLTAAGVTFEIIVHDQNLSTADHGPEAELGALREMAPTFILRTKAGYLAAIIRGDTRLSYKKIKRGLGLKDVCLASPDEVKRLTGSEVGHVPLINDGVRTIVDERVMEVGAVFGGSGEPRHTLRIAPRDLVDLTGAEILDIAEPKGEPQSPTA